MPTFKRALSSQAAKHTHIIYLRDDGTGETTQEKGHRHKIIQFIRPPVLDIDPETGQQVTQEFEPEPMVAPENGHSHDIGEIELEKPEVLKKDDKALEEAQKLYFAACEWNKESEEKAAESRRYYQGKQWDEDTRREFSNINRPALTFNICASQIRTLSGYQRQNRYDVKFSPIEYGDQATADILDVIVKIAYTITNFWFIDTEVFDDVAKCGLGAYFVYPDYDLDPSGQIKIEMYPWERLKLGPHEKKNCRDMEYFAMITKCSKESLVEEFDGKKDEIETMFTSEDRENPISPSTTERDGTQVTPLYAINRLGIDLLTQNILKIAVWRKEYYRQYIVVDTSTGPVWSADLTDWKKSDAESLKSIEGLRLIPRKRTRIRVTTFAGSTLLSDDYPELPIDNEFPLVPAHAELENGVWYGKLESAKDPQDEFNKRMSTIVDMLNKMDSSGWFYDKTTFPNAEQGKKLLKETSKPGFAIEVEDTNNLPKRVEGMPYPQEQERLAQLMLNIMDRISNINAELLGQKSNAESGVAEESRRNQALIGNEFIFDNVKFARKDVARWTVAWFKKVYPPERIMRILNQQAIKNPDMKIAGEPIDAYSYDQIYELLNNADLTKYDVAIEESQYGPTTRMHTLQTMLQLIQQGAPIPTDLIAPLLPVPEGERKKIEGRIQQMMSQQQQQAAATTNAEVMKAGGKPPAA